MLVIVQARLSSARLPGKVLRSLAGRPLLGWLLGQLEHCRRVSAVLVATSDTVSDDPVAAFAAEAGVACFRGSLTNVTGRMIAAAAAHGAAAFVRISGDSPLMDPRVVDDVLELFAAARPDLATNVQFRTFPKGFSVEVMRLDALVRAQAMMAPGDEEHVTPVFYRHPGQFRIAGLTSGRDWGGVQMSVDTEADFALVERMIGAMTRPPWCYGLAELMALRAALDTGMPVK